MSIYTRPGVTDVRPTDPVFARRIQACIDGTIPETIAKTEETGRIDAFRLNWRPGMAKMPHIFWDSDTAKVLEGMAYCLAISPDPELEKKYDEWVDLIVSAQQPDGYLNTFFTVVEPEKRWSNLQDCHELYCAGHLIEAAVAGYQCLGKRKLLDCLCRYADYIDSVFGIGPGKRRAWPGHQEIELALIKLYRVTGNERYRDLAAYFINDRGTEPHVYCMEMVKLKGQDISHFSPQSYVPHQAHIPAREQKEAVGHSVRAVYFYAGMADVADLTDDTELLEVCDRLFDSIATKRMYITGGIGSTFLGEKFTKDYDLQNGSLMYAESCAAMGLVQFALRMFHITGKQKYLDVAERALYNGVLSGINLAGDRFFYTNYLEMDENLAFYGAGAAERQPWFGCPCCPTSFSRFIPQLGSFLWSVGENAIVMNIAAACHADLTMGNGKKVAVTVSGAYPYDGAVRITLETAGDYELILQIPAWCKKYSVKVNGAECGTAIKRNWSAGDVVELTLDMPVMIIRANPKLTNNLGRVALQRGPVLYTLEQVDQTYPVRETILDLSRGFRLTTVEGLPEGTVAIAGEAVREICSDDSLYTESVPTYEKASFVAIPYALWQNRGIANMSTWNRFVQEF